jgi:tetratricopeptide (TPR) repeat protein
VKFLVVCLLALSCAATLAVAAPAKPKPTAAASSKAASTQPVEVDSLTLLEKTVARDSSVRNISRLAVMYLDRDRPSDAIGLLSRAITRWPNDAKLLVNLGAAFDASGDAESAQNAYHKALTAAPGDSLASCRLAGSLYASGKHQEAVDLLRGVIEHRPGAFCAYYQLGVAFADAGIYRDAIRMWKKVVELAPGSPDAVSAQESIDVLQKFAQP